MASYYKRINGKNYDRKIIDMADDLSGPDKKKGITLAGAKKIMSLVNDGGKVTDIEKRTVSYLLENYTFAEAAIKYIEKANSEEIKRETKSTSSKKTTKKIAKKTVKKAKSSTRKPEPEPVISQEVHEEPEYIKKEEEVVQNYSFMGADASESGSHAKKLLLLLLLIACIGAGIFAYMKFSESGNRESAPVKEEKIADDKPEITGGENKDITQIIEKKSDTIESVKNKTELPGKVIQKEAVKETVEVKKAEVKEKVKPEVETENVYIIQPGDTLISISEKKYGTYKRWIDIFRLNRKVLKKPSEIYPGHKIQLPEE